jgi:S-adenosylmethionine hydrolase
MMIALFTDFGVRDAYVAQMKGVILSINVALAVIDLNHEVAAFNVRQAAYLLEASSRYLPAGSIVVTVVDPGVGTTRRPVLCATQTGTWFVGPDNGVFTHVLTAHGLREAYELTESAYFRPRISSTFHGRDIFAPVAAHLASGVSAADFGPPVEDLVTFPVSPPRAAGQAAMGEIVHVDHFGNAVTNVTPDLLPGLQVGQNVSFTIDERRWTVPFCATYGNQPRGELVALVSSNDTLEIALTQGNASAQINAPVGTRITFERQP